MTILSSPDAPPTASQYAQVATWLRGLSSHLEPAGRQAVRQISRAAAPIGAEVRKRPVVYTVGALLVGAGIGLLLSRSAREAVGDTLARSWDVASGEGQQAAKTIRELLRR